VSRSAAQAPWGCVARLLALGTVALAAGCSSHSADESVVRFWAMGREGEVVAALVPEFERTHPGIRVAVQQLPWSAAHEKLLTAFAGDATPDVCQLGNTWIPEFVALNALLPLDSLDSSSPDVSESSFFPGIWRTNLVTGRLYGIPWYVDTRLLFYRKDLLAQAGYPQPPITWAQWRDAMRAVKARGGSGRYAIFAPFNEWNVPVILGLQAGSPLLKDDGRYGAFGEPPFRRAFDLYLDWYRSGVAPVLGINDVGNIYQEFERGTYAMWITGPWNIGEFRRRLPREMQDKWGTAPLPGPEGAASGVSMRAGRAWCYSAAPTTTPWRGSSRNTWPARSNSCGSTGSRGTCPPALKPGVTPRSPPIRRRTPFGNSCSAWCPCRRCPSGS